MEVRISENASAHVIELDNQKFLAPKHWFWPQFQQNWEPQTFDFFKRHLIPNTAFLDIGGWVGPTSLIATALGARKCRIIEPNPKNFLHLLLTQFNNPGFFEKWSIVNACISSQRNFLTIGPIEGINSGSSATNIRDKSQNGAEIISLTLEDILVDDLNPSLIKIDIEGAEAYIVEDLNLLTDVNAATWLSIHPPFIDDKVHFFEKIHTLYQSFYITDEHSKNISENTLRQMVLTSETHPEWGTQYGNFFEIGLLPKAYFNEDGSRKS